MDKNTGIKLLVFCFVSFFFIAFHLSGCPSTIANFFENPEKVYAYSDMPADIMADACFSGYKIIEEYDTRAKIYIFPSSNAKLEADSLAFVNNYAALESTYSNKSVVGYYSLAFMTDDKTVESIGKKITNDAGYSVRLIDFNKILNGYLEGKSWQDIGYDVDGKINIKAIYNSKNDIYYKMIESQILYELTGIQNQTQDDFDNNRELIDSVMNKIEKHSSVEYDNRTLYLICEQCKDFRSALNGNMFPCYEYYMAAEPLYMMYNDAKWESSAIRMTTGSYMNENIAATAKLRTPLDTSHSKASSGGNYRNSRSIDSINKIQRV